MRTTTARQLLDEHEGFAEYIDEQWQKLDDQLAEWGTVQRNAHDSSLAIYMFKDHSTLMVDTNGAHVGFPCKDCWEFVDESNIRCERCINFTDSYYKSYYGNEFELMDE